MRVCTATQMAAIDRETIAGGIGGTVPRQLAGQILMGRAGGDMAYHIDQYYTRHGLTGRILIICGKGNNGGDGLVAAGLLKFLSHPVSVLVLGEAAQLSPESRHYLDELPEEVERRHAGREDWCAMAHDMLMEAELVVDAIFGTGVRPPLGGPYAELIAVINEGNRHTISLDIPSGVAGDDGMVDPVAVQASLTITVELPKRGLLLPPGRDHVGELKVVGIGFPAEICEKHTLDHHMLPPEGYAELLPVRPSQGHKYDFGSLLILAGSRRYGGAAQLAALGGLRSGVGLVKVAAPEELASTLRAALPEAICVPLASTETGTIAAVPGPVLEDLLARQKAVAVGPGLDGHPETDAWLVSCLEGLEIPLVVDADGLGAFARSGREPAFGHDQVVLTPHAGELGRLLNRPPSEVMAERLELVPALARHWAVVLVLKGSPTVIGTPDGRVYFNPTGDDALARGGSGDLLSGLIGGFLAQGLAAREAALLGCYIHGLAGTRAASGSSPRSVLVREIGDAIGPVLADLEREARALARAALREKLSDGE